MPSVNPAMLADMTQPAHVRNDSHPADEPIEAAAFSNHVGVRRLLPLWIQGYVHSWQAPGKTAGPRRTLSSCGLVCQRDVLHPGHHLRQGIKVLPNNRQKGYPTPQLRDLAVEKKKSGVSSAIERSKGFTGIFDGKKAAMIQDRLSLHWFDPDQSFVSDLEGAKEKAGKSDCGSTEKAGTFPDPPCLCSGAGNGSPSRGHSRMCRPHGPFLPDPRAEGEYEEMESEMEGSIPGHAHTDHRSDGLHENTIQKKILRGRRTTL